MPSDHFIRDAAAFAAAVRQGAQAAADDLLVSFGIEPTSPHTGYGYIHGGVPLPRHPGCFGVQSFVEKPDILAAQTYLLTGEYYWNGGIFLFSPQTFLRELETFRPDMKTRKGFIQGYNAQAVVSQDQIVVACDVVQERNDVGQLSPMVEAAETNLYEIGEEPGKVLADAGYCSEDNLEYMNMPWGCCSTKSIAAFWQASLTLLSSIFLPQSLKATFSASVPENKNGAWGTNPIRWVKAEAWLSVIG